MLLSPASSVSADSYSMFSPAVTPRCATMGSGAVPAASHSIKHEHCWTSNPPMLLSGKSPTHSCHCPHRRPGYEIVAPTDGYC